MVLDLLSLRHRLALKKRGYQGHYGVGKIAGAETTLLQPMTFMNRSGESVAAALQSLGLTPGDLTVVHDDIELPFGMVRIKAGGGHGGNNGIRSIRQVLGNGEFYRVKIGVGRPPAGSGDVSSWVLKPFSRDERKKLPVLLENVADCVESMLSGGVELAMNSFNNRDLSV